jgi:hypothetical protein
MNIDDTLLIARFQLWIAETLVENGWATATRVNR